MKTLLLKNTLAICAFIGFLGSISWSSFVFAFNPQPDPPGFGMLGVTTGQVARFHVTLQRVANQIYPPDPFRVTLYFLNGDGRILTQQTFPVTIGQSISLDYVTPFLPTGLRQRIRPIVTVEADARGITPGLRSVVEVIDNDTQSNRLVYPGKYSEPGAHNPPSYYDSGIVGITRGQVARINVVNTLDVFNPSSIPPDPYRVTLSFYSQEGILLSQITRNLAPGQAASLDLNANNFTSNQGRRLEFHAIVTVDRDANGLAPCVMPTVEGFSLADGKTFFLIPAK